MAISTEQIQQLQYLGFHVEDMGKEYGTDFSGMHRWMNDCIDAFQDADTSDSPEEAWQCAWNFAVEQNMV